MVAAEFEPPFWLAHRHLQTILPNALRRRPRDLPLRREPVELPDGDFVDVDWLGPAGAPTVVVLHGLEGSIESPYAASLLRSLDRAGLRGALLHFRGCSGEPNRLPRAYHSGDTAHLEGLIAAKYPCVMYNRRLRARRGNFIVLDNARAARDLTRHLVSLGHRRIGFVGGLANVSTASERLRGYRLALRNAHMPDEAELTRSGAFKADGARLAARDLLKLTDRPTAIVAGSDLMALGVIQAAGDLSLRVPEDVAVVGFDDIEIAGHREIQLTTMAQQKAETGRLAVLGL